MSLFKKRDMASLYSMCIHKVFIFPPKLYKFLSWLKIILKAFCCVLRFNQIFSPISDCNVIFCVHFFPNYIAINNQAFVLRLRVGWGGGGCQKWFRQSAIEQSGAKWLARNLGESISEVKCQTGITHLRTWRGRYQQDTEKHRR